MATSANSQSAVSVRMISGSVGSLVTALAVTPLEVVKVHLQSANPITATTTAGASGSSASAASVPKNVYLCPKGCGTFVLNNGLFDCVLPKCKVPYFDQNGNLRPVDPNSTALKQQPHITKTSSRQLGTFAMVRRIFAKEGFRGIYAGLGPTLVMGIPSTAFYYTVYDELVARARSQPSIVATADAYVPLVAGSSARLMSTLLTAPLELIRTRQASMVGEGKEVRGMVEEFRAIVRHEGCGALYKGLTPTLWRDVPFSGIYWLCLEQFRLLYGSALDDGGQARNPLQQAGLSFVSGASAGMVAAACTTPFDVVKTRQQAVSETVESVARTELAVGPCNHGGHIVYRAEPAARPASLFAFMRTIYETEGIHGLWRGNQTRMIKVAPSCAIMITSYELGKRMLEPSTM